MASEAHQRLLNSLARALEKNGVEITHLDIDGGPRFFDEKYKNLPTPTEREGHIPDLEGKRDGLRHLGEAKIAIEGDDNLESQFKVFSSRQMNDRPIPFHIVVPKSLRKDIEQKLYEIGLKEKWESGRISIWS